MPEHHEATWARAPARPIKIERSALMDVYGRVAKLLLDLSEEWTRVA